MDTLSALKEAERVLAAEARAAILAARVSPRYQTQDIDPFVVLGASNRAGRFGGLPRTERQAAALTKAGIDVTGLDRGQASALLDSIISRSKRGLCTLKMARQLARFGLHPDVSFEDARVALDAIAAAGWRAPGWLYRDPRFAPGRTEAA